MDAALSDRTCRLTHRDNFFAVFTLRPRRAQALAFFLNGPEYAQEPKLRSARSFPV